MLGGRQFPNFCILTSSVLLSFFLFFYLDLVFVLILGSLSPLLMSLGRNLSSLLNIESLSLNKFPSSLHGLEAGCRIFIASFFTCCFTSLFFCGTRSFCFLLINCLSLSSKDYALVLFSKAGFVVCFSLSTIYFLSYLSLSKPTCFWNPRPRPPECEVTFSDLSFWSVCPPLFSSLYFMSIRIKSWSPSFSSTSSYYYSSVSATWFLPFFPFGFVSLNRPSKKLWNPLFAIFYDKIIIIIC